MAFSKLLLGAACVVLFFDFVRAVEEGGHRVEKLHSTIPPAERPLEPIEQRNVPTLIDNLTQVLSSMYQSGYMHLMQKLQDAGHNFGLSPYYSGMLSHYPYYTVVPHQVPFIFPEFFPLAGGRGTLPGKSGNDYPTNPRANPFDQWLETLNNLYSQKVSGIPVPIPVSAVPILPLQSASTSTRRPYVPAAEQLGRPQVEAQALMDFIHRFGVAMPASSASAIRPVLEQYISMLPNHSQAALQSFYEQYLKGSGSRIAAERE